MKKISKWMWIAGLLAACQAPVAETTRPMAAEKPTLAAKPMEASFGTFQEDLPGHPDKIEFRPLAFEPPKAKDYRHTLSGGTPVYLAPSTEFPLITVSFSFKGGGNQEPAGKAGLAGMTGSLMRRGGTQTISAEDMDEEFDFLAANASSFSGDTSSGASINCLKSNFEEAFTLFMDMVRNPGFQESRIKVYRDEVLEGMKQRNDDASDILSREWNILLYGMEHFEGRYTTEEQINSITVEDMRALHAKIFNPGNLIISVTGDFEEKAMLSRLEKALEGWQAGERMPDPEPPTQKLQAGLYRVEKDIPQGKVAIGMRTVKRDHPDYFAINVMNNILGSGGFTSRIMSRVRSDEGLAYSAGSSFSMGTYYPGVFRGYFQSKNTTVALAIKIIFEEIERIRTEPVTQEELDLAKNSFIETFPRRFESKAGTLGVFVGDEWTGRAEDYWQTYRDRIRAVTIADVQRVAKEHLRAQEMAILIVGKWDEISKGEERADMSLFFGGQATEIPLRDPMTMKPQAAATAD